VCAAVAAAPAGAASPAVGGLSPVSLPQLCVTEGGLEPGSADGSFSVEAPKMRAYLNLQTPAQIEARFRYLGPTAHDSKLASGLMRRQFGLKLRAADACNLVYAMWRIEPESKLVVSVKSNPGKHSSAECGNRGYSNIKPQFSMQVPKAADGQQHVLRAVMSAAHLKVFADGSLVWDGSVGSSALAVDGPVGVRSDNTRLQLGLLADLPRTLPAKLPACRSGAAESD